MGSKNDQKGGELKCMYFSLFAILHIVYSLFPTCSIGKGDL